MPTRPVWAEISLDRLTANYHFLRQSAANAVAEATSHFGSDPRSFPSPAVNQLTGTLLHGPDHESAAFTNSVDEPAPLASPELLAVVKANAYGHGVELCGPALAAAGARWLGVTSVDEGVQLRRALGVLPSHVGVPRILIMSGLWPGEADAVLEHGLTPQVWEPYHFDLLLEAARKRASRDEMAVSGFDNVAFKEAAWKKVAHDRRLGPAIIPAHLEIDTGMARQGVAPGQPLADLVAQYCAPSSPIFIEGVMTHFSAPEMLSEPDTDQQLARFATALDQLAAAGIHPSYIHAGNSATAVDPRHTAALAALGRRYLTKTGEPVRLMLRPGLALYGYSIRFHPVAQSPSDQLGHHPADLAPTMAAAKPAQPPTRKVKHHPEDSSPMTAPSASINPPDLRQSQLAPETSRGVPDQPSDSPLSNHPTAAPLPDQSALQPVLTWKTRITSIRTLAPGQGAGYNSIFRATRPTRLALVPVGYADGLNRLLSNPTPSTTSAMLVRGYRAPIAGRISMDQTILDITNIPSATLGDEVVILGSQGLGQSSLDQPSLDQPSLDRQGSGPQSRGQQCSAQQPSPTGAATIPEIITAWEHAHLCHTIPYEVLCNIATRVPRIVPD